MKKILILAALLGAMTASAEDSYLYWMVGDMDDYFKGYTSVKIRDAANENNYLTIYSDVSAIGKEVSSTVVGSYDASLGEGLYASLASGDPALGPGSSFIVELYSGEKFLGQSSALAYNSSYITFGGIGAPASTVALATGFAIPEPSSGMLMLIGCAVLGLRRRRQKNV